jgi:NitT/TauT family transport system permease protein
MAIPTDLKEATSVFGIRGMERWGTLVLPSIFPCLVTGLVTASGGVWNASIVAECFHFHKTISTLGLGSTISQATDSGNLDLLVAATVAMATIVVTINRLVWRRMYKTAQSKFTLES